MVGMTLTDADLALLAEAILEGVEGGVDEVLG